MTTLAARPYDDPDQLVLAADPFTPLGKLSWDAFKAACWIEACKANGVVDPNKVREHFIDHHGDWIGDCARSYAAKWSPASGQGPLAFLDVLDREVPISGPGSKGNGNKNVNLRRWRGWVS